MKRLFIIISICLLLAFCNGICWASASASSAVDAGISVDYISAVSFRDCAYWTFASTSSARNAGISDFISHLKYLL